MPKRRTGFMHADKDVMKGIVSMIILNHVREKRVYPYALLKMFRKSPHMMMHTLGKSDIYNVFDSLEHKGLVRSRAVLVGSKVQKRYEITRKGASFLNEVRRIRGQLINLIKSELS